MTFSHEDRRRKVTFRVSDEMFRQLDDVTENKSEFLRELVRDALGEEASSREGPADPDLADAYDTLLSLAHGGGSIPLDLAETELAQQRGRGKEIVRYTLIQQLCDQGYCAVKPTLNDVRLEVRA